MGYKGIMKITEKIKNFRIERSREKTRKDSLKLKKAERLFPQVESGLTSAEVEERKKDKLTNEKSINKEKSVARIIFENIFNFCNIITMALMILLVCIGAWDYTISSALIFFNMAIGIFQEIKAKKSVRRLSLVADSECDVVRNGGIRHVSTKELVLDDIFIINAGQQISVDAELKKGYIEVDESILTGESQAVRKNEGDQVLAGSFVLAGEATAQAMKVGNDCYIEGIAKVARKINKPTSTIFSALDKLIKIFSVVFMVLAVMMTLVDQLIAKNDWTNTAIYVSSSILGMIPIGMFLLTSTALASAVYKLTKKNALPKDLYSVEMLANVDTLLLDKTGTITNGKQEVVEVKMLNETPFPIKDIMLTLSKATRDKKPTAKALEEYYGDGELLEYSESLSFSSERKFSAVTVGKYTYVLGAPDYVAPKIEDISNTAMQWSDLGRRCIALSYYTGNIRNIEKDKCVPLCLFALEDELREDVQDTLKWFYENGVDIKIISGDNPQTVSTIAQKTGVRGYEKVLNCQDVDSEELKSKTFETTIFGRVSPEQKCDIVQTLQDKGKVVGMVGDGVNDVQALKKSDCSISFGSANEVARNISRIVLADNNFKTLPDIVQEGRQVISNVQRVSSLYIMKNIFVMFMTLMFAIVTIVTKTQSYPFDTKKLLLLEFFVIGAPTFIFALQKNSQRPYGSFIKNVLETTIPATLAMIFGVCFVFAMQNYVLDFSNVSADMLFNYKVSMATIAMTLAGFSALIIVSLPPNKLRICVIVGMIALSVFAIWIDGQYLDGTFLDMQFIDFSKPSHWLTLLGSVLIANATHLALNALAMKLEKTSTINRLIKKSKALNK